jgi:hypothetical protein
MRAIIDKLVVTPVMVASRADCAARPPPISGADRIAGLGY